MVFNSRVVPVFMLRLPKISSPSIVGGGNNNVLVLSWKSHKMIKGGFQ